MKKVASFDIGSYTARMLIAAIERGILSSVLRLREYINIAYSIENGRISEDAIKRTSSVIGRFLDIAKKNSVDSIYAIGTGVIREAKNRKEFLKRIEEETGLKINVISGKEEAVLSAKGAIYSLGIKREDLAVIDIGGGSTEFFIKKEKEEVFSVRIGAAVLTKKYLLSDPPKKEETDRVLSIIEEKLKNKLVQYTDFDTIIGVGGTITSLAIALYKIPLSEVSPENINGRRLGKEDVAVLLEEMKNMKTEKRAKAFGLDIERSKVIVAGTEILLKIMELLKAKEIIVSMSDLLEGIILKEEFGYA